MRTSPPNSSACANTSCDSDGTTACGHPGRRALRSPLAVILFLAISVGGAAGDLLSKHYVFEGLLNDPTLVRHAERFRAAFRAEYDSEPTSREVLHQFQRPVLPRVKFTLSANPGVVFGWSMPRWAVAIATIITMVLVGVFFATSDRNAWAIHAALACILAGAMGNLYDRLFSRIVPAGAEAICRSVRDFIDCSELYYPWVFNVADVLLVVGVGILALHWVITERKRKAAVRAAA